MAYEMRISDWSSDVCSSDLRHQLHHPARAGVADRGAVELAFLPRDRVDEGPVAFVARGDAHRREARDLDRVEAVRLRAAADHHAQVGARSEEHTSELQSLMRISYAVFCLKKKKN